MGLVNRLRVLSGLTMFAYVVGHLLNHSLGLVSLEAMNAGIPYLLDPWRTPAGLVLLLSAFVVHVTIALVSLARRRTLRLRPWEAAQLLLGLSIPPLLMHHVISTRIAFEFLGTLPAYVSVLTGFWAIRPWSAAVHAATVLVVWTHACIGLHTYFRLRPAYERLQPLALGFAVGWPLLALAGFAAAGSRVRAAAAADPGWTARVLEAAYMNPAVDQAIWQITAVGWTIFAALLAFVLGWRAVRDWRPRRSRVRVSYRGERWIEGVAGASLLEIIRDARIPHASVCGGRGRCSTCRVRVTRGIEDLPHPSALERTVLERFAAPPDVRLACQLRPAHGIEFAPLLPPSATARIGLMTPGYLQGDERAVAILFADLRDSTKLSEGRLPFDTVFVLNQFFAEMTKAIESTGGAVADFTGDGVMAIYGLAGRVEDGCRDALRGAAAMSRRLDALNTSLRAELGKPLRMGIGIHSGEAVVGLMGPPKTPRLSAIGDVVNVTARLEGLTKRFQCPLVVSAEAVQLAGLDADALDAHDVLVRGRDAPVRVVAVAEPVALARLTTATPEPA